MQFGKTAQLVLAIGIFAIAIVFLYQANQQKGAGYEQLNTQLAAAQQLLPKLITEKDDLEGRLSQLQVELDQAEISLEQGKAKFPSEIDGIDYGELLFDIAHDRDLEVIKFVGSQPAEQNVGEITYTITSFDLDVRGEVADILDFVNVIATDDDFKTASVGSVQISVPEPLTREEKDLQVEQAQETAADDEEAEKPESPSAVIHLEIYSYKGE